MDRILKELERLVDIGAPQWTPCLSKRLEGLLERLEEEDTLPPWWAWYFDQAQSIGGGVFLTAIASWILGG